MSNETTTSNTGVYLSFPKQYSSTAVFAIITGGIGCFANGSVLILLVVNNKLRKQSATFLIKFQLAIDFVSCAILIVSFALKMMLDVGGTRMKRWGLAICIMSVGDGLAYTCAYTATTNLGFIALERYIKIVHAVKHRSYIRRWMLYLTAIFSVVTGIAFNLPAVWFTSIDEHGRGYGYAFFPNAASFQAFAISIALWNYVLPLMVLIYCYGRIVLKLRKRSAVGNTTQAHSTVDSNAGTISNPQINVIKTMIIITVTYAWTTFAINFGYVAVSFGTNFVLVRSDTLLYVYASLYFMNAWLDPFIYAISNKDVRQQIWRYLRKFQNRSKIHPELPGTNTGGIDAATN